MTWILDASVGVDLVTDQGSRTLQARQLVEGHDLLAPSLIDLEVLNALGRLERARTLTADAASHAVRLWGQVPLTRCSDALLVSHAWRKRQALRVSDAFYLVLAEALQLSVLTSDARLARGPHRGVTVTLIG